MLKLVACYLALLDAGQHDKFDVPLPEITTEGIG